MQITSAEEGRLHQYLRHEAEGIDDKCGGLESICLWRWPIPAAYHLQFLYRYCTRLKKMLFEDGMHINVKINK